MERDGSPLRRESDGATEVKAQPHEVGNVIFGEALALEVSVHEAHATEAVTPTARSAEVRDEQLLGVSDDHVPHAPAAVEGDAELAVELSRELTEAERQRLRDDLARVHFALIEAAQPLQLTRLEPYEVTMRLQGALLVRWCDDMRSAG